MPQYSASSELALIDAYPPAEFRGTKALKEAITAKKRHLEEGSQYQYLSFRPVTLDDFARIKGRHRVEIAGRGTAFFYLGDIETLVLKLPTRVHEKAHATLGQRIQAQVFQMGSIGFDEFMAINATAIKGRDDSEKEADSAWQNERLRTRKEDWPNVVIEAGLGESLPRLQKEAKWWIEHSAGDVLVVLLVWVQQMSRTVKIEKWIPNAVRSLRRSSRLNLPPVSPMKAADIVIDQSSAAGSVCHGAPLRLEFDRIFGRPAQNALEHDVVFTQDDLEDWARLLWIAC
ncbi:hypothetical protein Plec18167_006218 [Paecilomyces lecythidis]|uniref:Uncharacterized protein n=1 Tax=Paecilomyces lecythidis TaxID=3004212 RepID=A0ABR3XD78_9EURO